MSTRRVMVVVDVPTTVMDKATNQPLGREIMQRNHAFEVDQTLQEVYDELKKYGVLKVTAIFESAVPEPRKPTGLTIVDPGTES